MPGPVTEDVFIAKADLMIARLQQIEARTEESSQVVQANQTREEVMVMASRTSGRRRRSMGRHGAL